MPRIDNTEDIFPSSFDPYIKNGVPWADEWKDRIIDIYSRFVANKANKNSNTDVWVELANLIYSTFYIITLNESYAIYWYNTDKKIWVNDCANRKKECILVDKICYKFSNGLRKVEKDQVLENLASLTWAPQTIFNTNQNLIPLKNGVFSFDTFTITEHKPDYFFLSTLPVVYNPQATCPNIENYIKTLVENDDVQLLYEIISFAICPGYPIKRAFFFYGPSDGGKTTFCEFLSKFIGEKNISAETLQDLSEKEYARANLYGKRLNISSENPEKGITDSSNFKAITGGDKVSARFLYSNNFYFINEAKIIVASNSLPPFLHGDGATYNRILTVEFANKFSKVNGFLNDKTTEHEFSGLFNKILPILQTLLQNGSFTELDQDERRKKYISQTNPIEILFDKFFEVTGNIVDFVPYYEIMEKYALVRPNDSFTTQDKLSRTIRKKYRDYNLRIDRRSTPRGTQYGISGVKIKSEVIDLEGINLEVVDELSRQLDQ